MARPVTCDVCGEIISTPDSDKNYGRAKEFTRRINAGGIRFKIETSGDRFSPDLCKYCWINIIQTQLDSMDDRPQEHK